MSNIEQIVNATLAEYEKNRKGTPSAFIRAYRRFCKVPGLSGAQAFDLAREHFPREHAAYRLAQNQGAQLPPLDASKKTSYEARRKAALLKGDCIN